MVIKEPRMSNWLWAAGWGAALTIAQIVFVCIAGDAPPAHGVAFSPDGKWLAAIGEDWVVRIWEVDGDATREIPPGAAEPVAVAFRRDGTLWTAQNDLSRTAWDPASGSRETRARGHTGGVHRQAFSADGLRLAVCAPDAIHVHNLADEEHVVVPTTSSPRAIAFSADGTRLAFADAQAGVFIGNLSEQTLRLMDTSGAVDALTFNPKRQELALAVGNEIRILDSGTYEELSHWQNEAGPCTVLTSSADGQFLAAGNADGSVTIWKQPQGSVAHVLAAHAGPVRDVAFSPDSHRLATAGADRRVMFWEADSGVEIRCLRPADAPAWLLALKDAYRRLCRWDVHWYGGIAAEGYHSVLPSADAETSNVAFFPGHPLLTRAIHQALGIPGPLAAVIASQLAAWGFWTYLFRFFRSWGMTARSAVPAALAVFLHPASFFLVNGYSESLFLLALLGFLYWERQPGTLAWVLAAGHGFVMTATRLVGLPLAGIPVLRTVFARWHGQPLTWSRLLAATGLASVTAAGGLSFFAFCAWQFGRWDLYMATQRAGWDVVTDYLAPLRWQLYWPGEGRLHLNRLSLLFMIAFAVLLLLRERQERREHADTGLQERLWFYFAAAIMLYISVCGLYHKDLASMIRYSLAVYVMLLLAGVQLASRWKATSFRASWLMWLLLGVTGIASLQLQAKLLRQYTEGYWVA
jgi:hypothetical protein